MDHPLAKICRTTFAYQCVNHFLCWRQLAQELRLDFCLLSAHLVEGYCQSRIRPQRFLPSSIG